MPDAHDAQGRDGGSPAGEAGVQAVDLELTKQRVEAQLADIVGAVTVDSTGTYSARSGSSRVFVRVRPHPDGQATLVNVFAIVLDHVPLTPELFEFVATDAATVFGTLLVIREPDGTGTLIMRHPLLGDYLDPAELAYAVGGIARSADEIDDQLAARFGGQVFHPASP